MASEPQAGRPAGGGDVAEDVKERVGRRVRARRRRLGLTLREAADRAGLSPRFYSDLEAGRANIAIGRLDAVARGLGCRLEELVGEAPPRGRARRVLETLLAGRSDAELTACLRAVEETLGRSGAGHAGVALLGLRGAGKSTLGPALATRLGVPFVELDERIEEAAGLGLSEIFALHGEGWYRRLSLRCLSDLLDEGRPVVVALPGASCSTRRPSTSSAGTSRRRGSRRGPRITGRACSRRETAGRWRVDPTRWRSSGRSSPSGSRSTPARTSS